MCVSNYFRLEIMDSISIQQESAYRRLYRWVREETRTLENDAAEPEYDRMVHIALKALRERPVYLSYVIYFLFLEIFLFYCF